MDRNLLLTKFKKSCVNFKANLNKIVIYSPDFTPNYEKRLTGNCFLITYDEYLKIDQPGRACYVFESGRSEVYIHPCKMIVKKNRHEDFILPIDKSLKDICDSTEYIEVNFTLVFDPEDKEWF